MRIAIAVGVVLLIGIAWIPAHALESLAPYDNFTVSLINPNKWVGNEGGLGAEATRIVQGGRFRMFYRAYGHTASNSGVPGSSNRLHFINPAAVTAMRATVNEKSVEIVNCPLNTEPSVARGGLHGAFFNAGTPGSPGDFTNDVDAGIRFVRRGDSTDAPGILRVRAFVTRCDDANCVAFTTLFFQDLGPITIGTTATLSMQWDQPNHQFIFGWGATTVTAPYTVSDTSPPANLYKQLEAQISVPNCTVAPRPRGAIDISFDDVFVNASAVIL